jgi:hypothetical protein
VEIGGLAEIEERTRFVKVQDLQIRVKVSGPAQNIPNPAFYPHVLPTR